MPINPQTLKRLRENDPTLIQLTLTQEVESDADVEALVIALKNNTHLKSLTIQGRSDGKGITDKGAQLLAWCRHLVFLDLSANKNITDVSARMFANHPALKTFLLYGCSVTPACHYLLFQGITLKYLRANDPDFGGLSLSHYIESDEQVAELVEALKNNTYLKSLTIQGRLDGKGISDESAERLASCHYLVFLDLSGNKRITDECVARLAKHPSLEVLYLRGCSVTPGGLYPFLRNNVITDLRIAMSPSPSEQVGESIVLKLKENANLTLEEKLQTLNAEHLSIKFFQFIHKHSGFIQKLPQALQVIAQTIPHQWEDFIISGLILSRNLSKLGMESAEVFGRRYIALREERQKFMQFQLATTQERAPKKIRKEESESPSLSPPPSPATYRSRSSLSPSI